MAFKKKRAGDYLQIMDARVAERVSVVIDR